LIFFSGFLYPKHKNLFRIYFSGIHYFQLWVFISEINDIFEIMLGAGSKVLGAGTFAFLLLFLKCWIDIGMLVFAPQ